MVWQVKSAPFWLCRGAQVLSGYHLLWAYDPLHPEEEKWFLVGKIGQMALFSCRQKCQH